MFRVKLSVIGIGLARRSASSELVDAPTQPAVPQLNQGLACLIRQRLGVPAKMYAILAYFA